MNRSFVLAIMLALSFFSVQAQTPISPAGHWVGGIELGNVTPGFSIDLDKKTADEWTGTISIPAQGMKDQALSNVMAKDGHVTFALPEIKGNPVFTGKLSADGQTITGELTQAGRTFPFRLERAGKDAADRFGPTPDKGVPGAGFAGAWQGTLDAGAVTLRLVFRITKAAGDSFTVLLDSPDQSVTDMKTDNVTVKEKSLRCELKRISAVYEGTLNQNGSEITGEFQQSGMTFPLTLKRLAQEKAKP